MKNIIEISDNRLAGFLRKHLRGNPQFDSFLKGQKLCGSKIIDGRFQGEDFSTKDIYLIANDKEARFYGNIHCHSPWCCPHCTPIVMAQKGRKIAAAIDALAQKYNQSACMITFTLPHTKNMSCKDTLEILCKTWRMFSRNGNKGYRFDTYTKKDGTTSTYKKKLSAYGQMRQELDITHHVKVFEITYGENSFHPHIHMLLWIPNNKFYDVIKYEDALLNSWWHAAEHCATKYYQETYPDKDFAQHVKNLFAKWRKHPKTGHKSVFISKDADGMPRKISSSIYITGWSGNFEVTYNYKHARNNHLTPHQILEKAYYYTYKKPNADKAKFYMNLYIEFAIATKKHRRVEFSSRSGITQIIKEWQLSSGYIEDYKKKAMEKEKEVGTWKNIAYFTVEQWLDLLFLEDHLNRDLRSELLELCSNKLLSDVDILEYTRLQVKQFLENLNIDTSNNRPFRNDNFMRAEDYYDHLQNSG